MIYKQEAIDAKLKQVEEFEAKWGENNITRSWRKWCTDEQYRINETKWRQSLSETVCKQNTNTLR